VSATRQGANNKLKTQTDMAIYKVHIATDGDKTSYTINGHELAAVTKTADGYAMTTTRINQTHATLAEADDAAKSVITKTLASLGCVPKFINE